MEKVRREYESYKQKSSEEEREDYWHVEGFDINLDLKW